MLFDRLTVLLLDWADGLVDWAAGLDAWAAGLDVGLGCALTGVYAIEMPEFLYCGRRWFGERSLGVKLVSRNGYCVRNSSMNLPSVNTQ